MKLSKPFIRLPYAFDAHRLAREAEALPPNAWMPHPSGMKGNSAVALVSRHGGDNDDFGGAMRVTRHVERSPYLKQVMASFEEVLGRSRLMRLAPGCEVSAHVDFNYHWYSRVRVHVPIVTEPEVMFYCGDDSLHMRPGECWIFNSWNRHRVVNGGRRNRIHLVIDLSGSSGFWRMVRAMESLDPQRDAGAIEQRIQRVEFDPAREVTIATERYDAAPVMSPGEIQALIAELVRDFADNPRNDAKLVSHYKEVLTDFGKDWRAIWHRYGYEPRGRPHYERLVEAVKAQLHPDPRALVTLSNGVGVNPIVVQRILRPALDADAFDQFLGTAGSSSSNA